MTSQYHIECSVPTTLLRLFALLPNKVGDRPNQTMNTKNCFDREFRQFHQFRSRSTINSVNPELLDDPVRILGRPQARG